MAVVVEPSERGPPTEWAPSSQGWGSSSSKVTKFPHLRNILVIKFRLKSNLVPQMRNFSPTFLAAAVAAVNLNMIPAASASESSAPLDLIRRRRNAA